MFPLFMETSLLLRYQNILQSKLPYKLGNYILDILCVQEVVNHFIYKMGHHFLDTQYFQNITS